MRLTYESVLNDAVQQPPTEKELQRYARIQRIEKVLAGLYILVVLALFAYAAQSFVCWLVAVVLTIAGTFLAPDDSFDFTPIPQHECSHALTVFSDTPESQRYLERLRELSRQVTQFDVDAAQCWRNTVHRNADRREREREDQAIAQARASANDEAYRKIYGLPSNN